MSMRAIPSSARRLRSGLELRPNFPQALKNRAAILGQLQRFDEAAAGFTRAIEINGKDVLAIRNRGLVYHDQGEHAKAIIDFDRAIELDPAPRDAGSARERMPGRKGRPKRPFWLYRSDSPQSAACQVLPQSQPRQRKTRPSRCCCQWPVRKPSIRWWSSSETPPAESVPEPVDDGVSDAPKTDK